jgi:hypothetical protein
MKLNRKVVAILVASALTFLGINAAKTAMFLRDVATSITPAQ